MKFRWLLLGLTALAIGQVGWWSHLLISKQNQLAQLQPTVLATETAERFRFMIVTEGLFFCVVLSLGMIYAYRAHQQRLNLQKTQSDFLSAVTHELKTPIANVRLSLDSLDRIGAAQLNGAAKYFDRAQRACDRLLSQVDRILTLASEDEVPLVIEKVEWSAVEEALRAQFEHDAAKIQWSTASPSGEKICFSGSLEATRLVLGCLIDNGLKYGCTGTAGLTNCLKVQLDLTAERVQIQVSDQGPGLNKGDLERVFDPFWRAKGEGRQSSTGTGLGLALSSRMAKRMGGELTASQGAGGVGLKFTLLLPRVHE